MNANEMTFGIEIETTAPVSLTLPGRTNPELQIGGRHNGKQVSYLPTGWKAESDSSIRPTNGYHTGCEIVSPVLKGIEGLRQVAEVLRTLREKGHKVNSTCGIHIHIGWTGNAAALARLVHFVGYLEQGLYAITGTSSRERGVYCKSYRTKGTATEAERVAKIDRYHLLNLCNVGTRKNTVEFRVFSGSTNITKILAWIQVCLGIVERAHNAKSCRVKFIPTAPTGGWAKAGVGQSETERLIGFLAWAAGTAKIHGGKRYGWIADDSLPISPLTAMKKLRQLAKQYDQPTTMTT